MDRPKINLAGIDVGLTFTKATSGVCRAGDDGMRLGLAYADKLSRKVVLDPVRFFQVLAIDAPVLPENVLHYTRRMCEYVFILPPFCDRCGPGLSDIRGTGQALRRAGCDSAGQFSESVATEDMRVAFPRVYGSRNIVEAFPNAFMGVLMDNGFFQQPSPGRGKKSDWLFRGLAETNRLQALRDAVGWGNEELWNSFQTTEDHDKRAALVCLLTAVCVFVGEYVAVGEATLGYFFLPPWKLWADWARSALSQNRRDNRVNPSIEVWINGVRYVNSQQLPEILE